MFLYEEGTYTIYCGHAVTGSRDTDALNPDPTSWQDAMSRPNWKWWVEASKKESQNLIDCKVFTVLKAAEVKQLLRLGVKIHTAKNVLKQKINAAGEPYKYKACTSFRGFTEVKRYDFN